MSLAILTATAVNGIITPARGVSSLGLIEQLAVPPEVLARQAELRRGHDAVVVGSGTVLADDPSLASHLRTGAAAGGPGVRATLDSRGRIPPGARFLDGAMRTLVGVTAATPRPYLDLLAERGVEAVPCGGGERADLALFVAGLAARGLPDLLVEGGGRLNRALLDRGLVDRLHLLVFPAVLDATSVNLFDGPGSPVRLDLEACERLGSYLHLRYLVLRALPGPPDRLR